MVNGNTFFYSEENPELIIYSQFFLQSSVAGSSISFTSSFSFVCIVNWLDGFGKE